MDSMGMETTSIESGTQKRYHHIHLHVSFRGVNQKWDDTTDTLEVQVDH